MPASASSTCCDCAALTRACSAHSAWCEDLRQGHTGCAQQQGSPQGSLDPTIPCPPSRPPLLARMVACVARSNRVSLILYCGGRGGGAGAERVGIQGLGRSRLRVQRRGAPSSSEPPTHPHLRHVLGRLPVVVLERGEEAPGPVGMGGPVHALQEAGALARAHVALGAPLAGAMGAECGSRGEGLRRS